MDPDQTARMRRLVCIHAGRKTHYVGFVMARLIYMKSESKIVNTLINRDFVSIDSIIGLLSVERIMYM
jgi:hypothetical protein